MHQLNRESLFAGEFDAEHAGRLDAAPLRALQIGDGNFLRAFADWMIDIANGAGVTNIAVTIMAARGPGCAPRLNAREGLYTVLSRGIRDGKAVEERRVVSCVEAALDPNEPADWQAALRLACDPQLRFLISNTTEAGIVHVAEPIPGDGVPQSFPAKVAALLWARHQALGDTAPGLTLLPCELIEGNGQVLQRIVLQHAQAWRLPAAFIDWVGTANHFCNTLVDRIVPGFPATEADVIFADCGYSDPLLVAAEPFHLWVIEAPSAQLAALSERFPLHKAGLDVVWTQDMRPYRTRKVRILNGAHTAGALTAFAAGIDTVREMVEDADFSRYLNRLVFDEIVPFVPQPEAERERYARTILERFANPFIRHELGSIALNSVSKWQVRVLPTVKDYVREYGKAPPLLAFSLAGLLNFYHGRFDAEGQFIGSRHERAYPIRDNAEVLAVFSDVWREWQPGDDVAPVVTRILGDVRLWGEDLRAVDALEAQVTANLEAIKAHGMRAAVQAVLAR